MTPLVWAGAFRVFDLSPATSAGVRVAALAEADGFAVVQATPRVSVGYRRFGAFFELPAAVGWSTPLAWSHAGLGNYRFGLAMRVGGDDVRHGLTLEVLVPQGWESATELSFWATVAQETRRQVLLQSAWSVAWGDDAPWVFRLELGYQNDDWIAPYTRPAASVALAHMEPLVGPLSFVAEAELLVDPTPFTVRALARASGDHYAIDLGVQLPVVELAVDGALPQLVAQVRARI